MKGVNIINLILRRLINESKCRNTLNIYVSALKFEKVQFVKVALNMPQRQNQHFMILLWSGPEGGSPGSEE